MNGISRKSIAFTGAVLLVITIALPLVLVVRANETGSNSYLAWNGSETAMRIDGGGESGWDEEQWYVQVDGVMGGKSSGDLEFVGVEDASASTETTTTTTTTMMSFKGDINLDGGGFSSVRRRINLDLTGFSGVVVTLEASPVSSPIAPPTGLHLQFGDSSSYYDFSSALAVPLGGSGGSPTLASVYLPLETFDRGTRFGFSCNNNCAFDPSRINGMSVYVLFQEGDFDVRIASIEAVTEPVSFSPPVAAGIDSPGDAIELLRATVRSGGGLYDKSYVELCVTMYWSVLNSLLRFPAEEEGWSLPGPVRAVICEGLERAERELFPTKNAPSDKAAAAWTLRYTIDAVVADLNGSERVWPSDRDSLPTPLEAEAMEATCVGRTSPAPGPPYDPRATEGGPELGGDSDSDTGGSENATATDDPYDDDDDDGDSLGEATANLTDSGDSLEASAATVRSGANYATSSSAVSRHSRAMRSVALLASPLLAVLLCAA
ncbi:unnamed protein product [Pseudo-nitzschia multistriata]|uniref:NADH:ubiquinone oxidoreductase intermediate-associated protein 30 domain-containing protein n=1 Tax=Pseudo-nitzschia multistriata TaxID=183589 RepID=A0A448ZCV7_9STRA|nr:unnamed protein product [Pseudo-nitzschia multistriata]